MNAKGSLDARQGDGLEEILRGRHGGNRDRTGAYVCKSNPIDAIAIVGDGIDVRRMCRRVKKKK